MNRRLIPLLFLLPAMALGCGHSEDEWQAQLHKYDEMVTAKDAEIKEAKARVAQLESDLQRMGVKTNNLESSLADREKALEEYKARARQLEAIKARFELLRHKLDALTKVGLAVHIRHNRMVISMPGDVLFDTGKDTLRPAGKDILGKVAAVIANDPSLRSRYYQVAGHTDNQPLHGGVFHDNWGLSLMRGRSVLLFLVGDGGILPKSNWSAAGFADTDPVASNSTSEGQQKNRRCDIIVVPSAEEMLDLSHLAN